MGRQNRSKKKKKSKGAANSTDTTATNSFKSRPVRFPGGGGGAWIYADPYRIRYQHSRIRPYFSGCGRSVEATFEMIRDGKMAYSDLPAIQVIVGPEDPSSNEDGPWYFSLNNRRLWVLKRCREEGLLEHVGNVVQVRVKKCKSDDEARRYTVEKCSLKATFMREARRGVDSGGGRSRETSGGENNLKDICRATESIKLTVKDDVEGEKIHASVENVNDIHRDNDEDQSKSMNHKNVNNAFDDVNDDSESEEDIEPRIPIYKNPFCFNSDSSSSDESSD